MKTIKHFMLTMIAVALCIGFSACNDDGGNDSKQQITGYFETEDGEEFYYFHPNGCGFGGYLSENPPEIYDVFESYVITDEKELIINWLDCYRFSTDSDSKGIVTIGKNFFAMGGQVDFKYIKKSDKYPYPLNFQCNNEGMTKWWNEHTK